jgi:glycosyltransferase involved in cell wall biosynthesis
MSGDRVSCIVPVYNGEAWLAETIESILAQTHPPFEVIVVDDGSTDGTAARAQAFPPPVRYVRQENAGPAAARNHGIAESRGAFLAFLDADDLWHPDKLSRQIALMNSDPALAYSVTLIQNFWIPELQAEAAAWSEHHRSAAVPGYSTSCLLVRRSAMRRVGPFNEALKHGDAADWFLRARTAGLTERLIPEVLTWRRMHGENRSRELADESRDEFLHFLKRSLDERRAGGSSEPPA